MKCKMLLMIAITNVSFDICNNSAFNTCNSKYPGFTEALGVESCKMGNP